MRKKIVILGGILLFFSTYNSIKGQALNASDTSEQSVRRYLNVINNKKELVRFIENTLSSRGIPKHLRNLAVIESGLDASQVSNKGAKGIWQFMNSHANMYGLSDQERGDIAKSTKTAASSLINLYNKYGNWITVIAAYSCGEGGVQKAMQRAGSRRYTDFATYLPSETQNHVKKYLNASYATGELQDVLSDYERSQLVRKKYTPKVITPQSIHNFAETRLNSGYDLDVIAQILSIEKSQLLTWNPGIEDRLIDEGETTFYLPKDTMLHFLTNKSKILIQSLKNE